MESVVIPSDAPDLNKSHPKSLSVAALNIKSPKKVIAIKRKGIMRRVL